MSTDIIGPYNTSTKGNSYTLTAVYNLTGYLVTTPIPDKKTATVATHLFSEIMLKFGSQEHYIKTMEQNLSLNLLNISHNNLV